MTTYKELMMRRDAYSEMRNKIHRELAAHPETSGGEILTIDTDPRTEDLLITWQHTTGQRTYRITIKDETADVPRETSSVEDKFTYAIELLYQVNAGHLRTAQRTVQARDDDEAESWARAHLVAQFPADEVHVVKVNMSVLPDGGAVVDVPRETSKEDQA
jgi:hypothetical protein